MNKVVRTGLLAIIVASTLGISTSSKAWGRRRAYYHCEKCGPYVEKTYEYHRPDGYVVEKTYGYHRRPRYRSYRYRYGWSPGIGVGVGFGQGGLWI